MEGLEQELHSFIESNCHANKEEDEDLDISGLDEIVLSYVTNVVEELHNGDDNENSFDLDEFAELMKEYIPKFKSVDNQAIGSWVIGLAKKMKQYEEEFLKEMEENGCYSEDMDEINSSNVNNDDGKPESTKEQAIAIAEEGSKNPDENNVLQIDEKQHSEALQVLVDMFPNLCPMVLKLHLATANDNIDSAIDLLLSTNNDDTNRHRCTKDCTGQSKISRDVDDVSLKDLTISRYGYVEVSEEEKTSNPVLKSSSEKKLTRFRDNKVVSTRGEKFVDVKPAESEEMKKTYVNLKPARKYRFH